MHFLFRSTLFGFDVILIHRAHQLLLPDGFRRPRCDLAIDSMQFGLKKASKPLFSKQLGLIGAVKPSLAIDSMQFGLKKASKPLFKPLSIPALTRNVCKLKKQSFVISIYANRDEIRKRSPPTSADYCGRRLCASRLYFLLVDFFVLFDCLHNRNHLKRSSRISLLIRVVHKLLGEKIKKNADILKFNL